MNKRNFLFVLIVPLLILACGVTVHVPASAPAVATQITESLMGKDINVFGPNDFVSDAHVKFTGYGAVVMDSADLTGALQLSGSGFVEAYCFDDQGRRTIITAHNPMDVLAAPIGLPGQCTKGFVLVGFTFADQPDIVMQ